MHELSDERLSRVSQTIKRLSLGLQTLTGAPKMNIAALGNMVPQLHIHIIARREEDASWPGPVWGVGAAEAYTDDELRVLVAALQEALLD
jgi:diadenosine tetraphosphate (Ap4A) HIT family hydrolase